MIGTYEGMRRVQYEGGTTFVPVCLRCGRFVKADKSVSIRGDGQVIGPTATCAECGRTEMPFEGYIEEPIDD